jgi:hypothetical protein
VFVQFGGELADPGENLLLGQNHALQVVRDMTGVHRVASVRFVADVLCGVFNF